MNNYFVIAPTLINCEQQTDPVERSLSVLKIPGKWAMLTQICITSCVCVHNNTVAWEWCTKLVTGMDNPSEKDVTISSYKRFLEVFCRDVEEPSPEENDSPVRHVSYMLEPTEIEGESLQWALDYLSQMQWVYFFFQKFSSSPKLERTCISSNEFCV